MPLNQKSWTTKEDQFLKDHYQAKSHEEMAQDLGRTRHGIRHRCHILKLFVAAVNKAPPQLYSKDEDQFILDNFSTMTHKEMGKALNRSTESLRSRCRTLNLKKPAHMVVAPIKTGQIQPEGLDLSSLPAHIQKWFGLAHIEIPQAAKPFLRHIAERMPDFTVSKSRTHIGSGTQFMISELANL